MKRSMKRWLAIFLALSMTMAPVMSIRAEEAQVTEDEPAAQGEIQVPENEPAAQEEAQVQGEQVQQKEQEQFEEASGTAAALEEMQTEVNGAEPQIPAESMIGPVTVKEQAARAILEQEEENTVLLSETEGNSDPEPETPGSGASGSKTPDDGKYQVSVDSSNSMFKVVDCVLTVKDGIMNAVITLSGTGYDYLYMGTKEEAGTDEQNWIKYVLDAEGKYTYTVPVSALDIPIAVAAHSSSKDSWYDRTLTFNSEGMQEKFDDGQYQVSVASSNSMFKVVDCVLTVKDGIMNAVITLSGTGYDYLYMGTKEEAGTDEQSWIKYVLDAEGKYTYTVPVSALDMPIAVAAHSSSKDSWYDRTLTFQSEGMVQISTGSADNAGDEGSTGDTGNTGNTGSSGNAGSTSGTAADKTPEAESKYESDLSGSTGKVNNATKLKDGVYTPDSFSWSGGTGKVNISCSKITVINGQAYATIVFSSSAYNYVKANGNKYYASHSGDTSIFTIPVELNKNNQIIGMTTKMSAAHEVAYSIFIYLKVAAEANGETVTGMGLGNSFTLDEEAPDILGLEYEDEVVLDYAKYFKIFQYEQGITLLEIDMMSDTAREDLNRNTIDTNTDDVDGADDADTTDNRDKELDDADENETSSEMISEEEGSVSEVKTQGDIVTELYQENVVKYLIVPEGVEIPAGLDKEVIVIRRPTDKAEDKIYAASNAILEQMEQIDMLEAIAAVACGEEECQIDQIAEKMEKEEVIYAGTYDEPDYKALISSKCNLAILPADILPREMNAEENIDSEETEALTVEEQEERLAEMTEKYALLGIPMVADRSSDEEESLAQKEWVKVYGALFGCEERAEELFAEAVAAEK